MRTNTKALDAIRAALETTHGADVGEKYVNLWYEIDAILRSEGK